MAEEKKPISIWKVITMTAVIIGAVETIGGFLLYPKFEDAVIEIYDAQKKAEKEENYSKDRFRTLIGKKMKINDDEVHIKAGMDHKTEDAFRTSTINSIDSLKAQVTKLSKFDKRVRKEVMFYHPGTHLQVVPE